MPVKKVNYPDDLREEAKTNGLRLATVSVTHPGGKPAFTSQVIVNESEFEQLVEFGMKLFKNGGKNKLKCKNPVPPPSKKQSLHRRTNEILKSVK